MRTLKVVVIDDEKNAVESIVVILQNFCEHIEICGVAYSAAKGIELAQKEKPDLVFVDIEMPDGTGFDVAGALINTNALIVFVTAFGQYAVKAFKANAVDYILKPVNIDEIKIVVEKARNHFEQLDKFEQLSNRNHTFSEKICLPTGSSLLFVDISHILHIEADGRYSKFYFDDKDPILICKNLGEIEEMLSPQSFFRTHHSSLVNLAHVLSLNP